MWIRYKIWSQLTHKFLRSPLKSKRIWLKNWWITCGIHVVCQVGSFPSEKKCFYWCFSHPHQKKGLFNIRFLTSTPHHFVVLDDIFDILPRCFKDVIEILKQGGMLSHQHAGYYPIIKTIRAIYVCKPNICQNSLTGTLPLSRLLKDDLVLKQY